MIVNDAKLFFFSRNLLTAKLDKRKETKLATPVHLHDTMWLFTYSH